MPADFISLAENIDYRPDDIKRVHHVFVFITYNRPNISWTTGKNIQAWTFELLEINTYTSDPNLIDLAGEVIRLGRGEFGFSGFCDLKIDLYDDLLVQLTFEISSHRGGPYNLLPLGISNETLTNAMNKFYKPLVQASAEKCATNAPMVKKKFVPPLTKRNVVLNNCVLATDNMPNIMPLGYQRMRIKVFGPFEMMVESISYIESKKL